MISKLKEGAVYLCVTVL